MKPDMDVALSEKHTLMGEAKTNGASGVMHPGSGAKAILSVASKLLRVLPEEAEAAGIALARQKLRISNTIMWKHFPYPEEHSPSQLSVRAAIASCAGGDAAHLPSARGRQGHAPIWIQSVGPGGAPGVWLLEGDAQCFWR